MTMTTATTTTTVTTSTNNNVIPLVRKKRYDEVSSKAWGPNGKGPAAFGDYSGFENH